jgi:hypothetical protein
MPHAATILIQVNCPRLRGGYVRVAQVCVALVLTAGQAG